MEIWREFGDDKVRHIWVKACDCELTDEDPRERVVGPDFYQESGEPSCSCCNTPYNYSHTEVKCASIT